MTNVCSPLKHWEGEEGDHYRDRQDSIRLLDAYIAMWRTIISRMDQPPRSVIEMGANTGINLDAIRIVSPNTEDTYGLEPNARAGAVMLAKGHKVIQDPVQAFKPLGKWDLAFTRGVLIHVEPSALKEAYRVLHDSASKYIVLAEYYNPTPVDVPYRGRAGLLWKRDFAGEMLDAYPDLFLVDYGFIYHRDAINAQDDVTWFLLRKRAQDEIPEFLKKQPQ